MTTLPVTPEQAQHVRDAVNAVAGAQRHLTIVVSTLASGRVPDGSKLLGVTENGLLFDAVEPT